MSEQEPDRYARAARRDTPPPAPEPLVVPVLDSHTHLDVVGGDPAAQIEAAAAVGVDRLVQVGTDVESSQWAVRLARQHPGGVAAVGLHPNDAPRCSDLASDLARQCCEVRHRRTNIGGGQRRVARSVEIHQPAETIGMLCGEHRQDLSGA